MDFKQSRVVVVNKTIRSIKKIYLIIALLVVWVIILLIIIGLNKKNVSNLRDMQEIEENSQPKQLNNEQLLGVEKMEANTNSENTLQASVSREILDQKVYSETVLADNQTVVINTRATVTKVNSANSQFDLLLDYENLQIKAVLDVNSLIKNADYKLNADGSVDYQTERIVDRQVLTLKPNDRIGVVLAKSEIANSVVKIIKLTILE